MATAKRTANDFIFAHPASRNLFVRLRDENGRRFVKSLGTSDRLQAQILAAPLITEHRARILAARPRIEPFWKHELEPGRKHTSPDGGEIIATDRELIYLNDNGAILKTEPNGGLVKALIFSNMPGSPFTLRLPEALAEAKTRPTVPAKSGDDAILEAYLKYADITGYYEREARATWALFKSLCDKPLKDADYDDGRKLVEHFEAEGLKRATIEKKIGWLRAAVRQNMRTKNGLRFNPFSNVVSKPKPSDRAKRLPLDDADMKTIKRNLDKLNESDQLLLRLLAATGMRLSEAFEINSEMKERGVRYVVVGQKTKQSLRRVPLPAAVLPYLPAKITGPLFVTDQRDPSDAASKLLNRFLDDCGIIDPRKVVHSLRHRAQDRLRAASCPQDIREQLLGHEQVTVGEGYGVGSPVPMLKRWVDKIGF